MIDSKLLTAGQTARRFRVPANWIRSEAEAGRIPHLKAGDVFLFNPEVVEEELLRRASSGSTTTEGVHQ
jgi:hypothetical protein